MLNERVLHGSRRHQINEPYSPGPSPASVIVPPKRTAKPGRGLIKRDVVFGLVVRRLRPILVEVDAHRSQFTAEGPVLERGEQGVELREVRAVGGFESIDFGHAVRERAL